MARPTKDQIQGNPDFLRDWADFQRDYKGSGPILLPVSVNMVDGIIVRNRIKAGDLALQREKLLNDFEAHCSNLPGRIGGAYTLCDFKHIMDEYIKWFESDDKQNPFKPSPLDLRITRPVWILFHADNDHWTFSEHRQFSVENDRDDHMRNCVKICTLDNNNMFLMENRWRIAPLRMKYNLHVTITQEENGETLYTDIIIDPGLDNDHPP